MAVREDAMTLYGFATDEPWELVSIRQHVSIPRKQTQANPPKVKGGDNKPAKSMDCVFSSQGSIPTPRYDRTGLVADQTISGPAVIEDAWSTVILPPGSSLNVDAHGHLHIDVGVTS